MPSSKQLLEGSKMWSLLLVPSPHYHCPSKVFLSTFYISWFMSPYKKQLLNLEYPFISYNAMVLLGGLAGASRLFFKCLYIAR